MHFCFLLLITSEIFQSTNRYRIFQSTNQIRCQFVGEVMTGILSRKEIIECATLGIPKGMKKMKFLFLLLSTLTEMKMYFSRNAKENKLGNNIACGVCYKPSKLQE